MDLELLLQDNDTNYEVTPEDQAILINLLEAAQTEDPKDSARSLEKKWKDLFPSSKQERDALLEIWAAAGILVPGVKPRKRKGGSSDFIFAATWQGDDGYHAEAVKHYFGSYLPQM